MSSNNSDPSPRPKRQRRSFSGEYKLRMIAEYEACTTSAERSALLSREKLHHSHINTWRKASETGALANLRISHTRDRENFSQDKDAQLSTRLEKKMDECIRTLKVIGALALLQGLAKND